MYKFDKGEKEKLVKRISEEVAGYSLPAERNLFRLLRPGEKSVAHISIKAKDSCAEYTSFDYVMNGSLPTKFISTSSDVKGISSFIADNVIFSFQNDCQLKQHVMYIAVIQRDLLQNEPRLFMTDLKDETCREEIINDHFKDYTEYYEGYVQKFNEITNEFSDVHVLGRIMYKTGEMYRIFSMTVIRDSHAYVIVCNPVNLINTAAAQQVIPAQLVAQPVIPQGQQFNPQFLYSSVHQPYYPQQL